MFQDTITLFQNSKSVADLVWTFDSPDFEPMAGYFSGIFLRPKRRDFGPPRRLSGVCVRADVTVLEETTVGANSYL